MHVDVVFNKFVPCCKFQSGICRYTRGGGDDNCVWGFRVLEVEDPVKFNQAFRAIVPPGKPTHTHTCTHTCIYACTRQGNVFFTPKTDPVVHVLIPFLPSRSLSLVCSTRMPLPPLLVARMPAQLLLRRLAMPASYHPVGVWAVP